jgi:hypothetical protein
MPIILGLIGLFLTCTLVAAIHSRKTRKLNDAKDLLEGELAGILKAAYYSQEKHCKEKIRYVLQQLGEDPCPTSDKISATK